MRDRGPLAGAERKPRTRPRWACRRAVVRRKRRIHLSHHEGDGSQL